MLALLAVLVGLLSFYKGFFPAKAVLPGFNQERAPVEPKYSKLVFMVVDAMRSDFMFGSRSNMSNVHNLIRSGNGLPFTGFSNPPTVTLPRLKGITTGSAPSFFDAVLNIAETSASALGDSWIHQLQLNNKSIHMYGDDTWLKIFPDLFDKVEGTSSFFVSDYTEVDNNVTRHVAPSLQAMDWDVLILHYLGLDHIGHKGGPESPLMRPKQGEMDSIVQTLYDGIDDETLLIVTGDHGMNEVGNHGGSSAGETSAALLFLSKQTLGPGLDSPLPESPDFRYYDFVPQIDLVPTIAMLLGLPVPQNSLGLPITSLVESNAYMCNHFSKLLGHDFENECTRDHLLALQDENMRASTEYNVPYMVLGLAICSIAAVFSIAKAFGRPGFAAWLVASSVYSAAMFGSSTIEEEHQLWFWALVGLVGLSFTRNVRSWPSWLLVLVVFRLARSWHNMGQKWFIFSVSQFLAEHGRATWALVALTYLGLVLRSHRDLTLLLGVFFSISFKLNSAKLAEFYVPEFIEPVLVPVPEWATLLYRAMLAALIVRGVVLRRPLKPAMELFILTQSRIVDIPLFGLFSLVHLSVPEVPNGSLVTLVLQQASFFAMGGSNSLATIDLSNAYNGLSNYNIPLVGFLTLVSNWNGPVFWSVYSRRGDGWKEFCTMFYSMAAVSITLACFLLRDHLFVWTVFSPKLLYFGAWLAFTITETLVCR